MIIDLGTIVPERYVLCNKEQAEMYFDIHLTEEGGQWRPTKIGDNMQLPIIKLGFGIKKSTTIEW